MRAEVVKVDGGREVSLRLAQLGIYLGTVLQVKQSAPLGGPILIEAGGTTVAVGRGLARKILVRPLP
jgi:ferrous iron transport protein A